MQNQTLDDYSISELFELSEEELLKVRRTTVEFITRILDPNDTSNNKKDTSKI